MYGRFYKVLWKLLVRAQRSNGNGTAETEPDAAAKKTTTRKTFKNGYAVALAGCRAGDGASTMAFNFASAFAANSSKSVILVDGNLHDPVLHHQFTVKKKKGLSDLVTGRMDVDNVVTEVTTGRYYFLQAGASVANPVAVYESPAFAALMEKLRAKYDLIIVDAPPLIESPEALVLASGVDGVIMVLQAEETRWEEARSAQSDLASVGIPLLGAVLNKKQLVIPDVIARLI
jgi:capsular exopolysaccharide synthesis family protein